MKAWRQSQILELVDREPVSSQQGLRQKLLEKGITATQATVSRDLRELGLVKRAGDGAYVRPGTEQSSPALNERVRRAVAALVRSVERVDPMVVVRTDRGQAQGLAEWIDRAHLTEVAGSVAGDDTILLVCRGPDAARTIEVKPCGMVKG
jgi:transcriptional regulator of arginine metabolism